MKTTLKKLAVLSLATTLSYSANAEIQWNGFASIVAGQTTSSDETFYDYDDSMSFDKGSLFALQASSDLGNGLGVTAQIIARGDDEWDPEFEWAYVSYEVNDNVKLLLGRQRAPFYMFSDYLDVSYAYPWISSPIGVYNLPFSRMDGASAIYTTTAGEFDISTQLIYGNFNGKVKNDGESDSNGQSYQIETNGITGLSVTLNRDWLTLRGGYFFANDTNNLSYDALNSLVNAWRQTGFNDIAEELDVVEDDSIFKEFGVQIDYNDYLLIAEYASLEIKNTFRSEEESYYVTLGKRFGSVMVHATYGKDDNDSRVITGDVPSGVDPMLDSLKATTDGILENEKVDSKYITLGARWDFHSSAAFKLEYTDYTNSINESYDAGTVRAAIVTVF